MFKFDRYFKNPFADPEISDDELQKYSADHLARIAANNSDGRLTDMITSTAERHTSYFGAITNEDVATAVRQGMTLRVDNTIAEFKKMVQRKEGAIRDAFGTGSPEYLEFFPLGREEYSSATKETVERLMVRMETSSSTHQAALGADLHAQFQAIYTKYEEQRKTQMGKKGEVDDHKSKTAANRTELEWQLLSNIHQIGFLFNGDEKKCMSYFDQSILEEKGSGKKEDGEAREQDLVK